MKIAQLSLIAGVLLLQLLIVKAQSNDDPANEAPQEGATRSPKDSEPTFPPVMRSSEMPEKDGKNETPAPAASENATKTEGGGGGGANSLFQSVALVFGITSFLYLV